MRISLGFSAVAALVICLTSYVDAVPCRGIIEIGPDVRTITSDNFPFPYEEPTFCRWHITGPEGTKLQLRFTEFNVESGFYPGFYPVCDHDFVRFYDPAITTPRDFGEAIAAGFQGNHQISGDGIYDPLCGKRKAPMLAMLTNRGVLDFITDNNTVTKSGWSLELLYTSAEPPVWEVPVISLDTPDEVKFIASPNYPGYYYDNYISTYVIKNDWSTKESVVQLESVFLDLGPDCHDTLTAYDVANDKTHVLCGQNFKEQALVLYFQNWTEILLTLKTDATNAYRGFRIQAVLLEHPPNTIKCDDGKGAYNAALGCDGVRHCEDGSDEKKEYCTPECGVSHFPMGNDGVSRVMGGEEARRFSLPWHVAMIERNPRDMKLYQVCGGTLISDQWVLSAAHCIFNETAEIYFRVGGHKLSLTAEEDGAIDVPVEKYFEHPDWLDGVFDVVRTVDYDYILHKLKFKVPFRKNIVPACLPRQGLEIPAGTKCISSGMGVKDHPSIFVTGRQRPNDPLQRRDPAVWAGDEFDNVAMNRPQGSNNLFKVEMTVISDEHCRAIHDHPMDFPITPRMICAGAGYSGNCNHDSGGPLVCQDERGRWLSIGIVSTANDCGNPDYPIVYEKTSAVTDWISDIIMANQ
ncbi:putative Transmembrane protease serine 6 [Hypsibius exemplaris]|uniref:Transmembrane protease serine 6 n=1 Tax=Hypsibius exemplaris TaxID=2072580 RepID=A0A1W0WRM0_HYPEX|nr:putative Transmembrane protease serine 6 [Hypsibius exemplaris]